MNKNTGALTRRGFLAATAAGAFLSPRPARAADRPNILLLVSDDLGWNDVGFHNPGVRTPNLDRLAAKGVRLEQYRTMSVCSPTRCCLLTGRSAFRLGVPAPIPRADALPIQEQLLPQLLSDAGYQTALVGKWHLGEIAPEYFPHRRGFDSFYGYMGGETSYWEHRRNGNIPDWYRNGELLDEEGYTTDLLANEAIRVIRERDQERPFFLDVSLNAPHVPLEAQEEYLAKFAHIADPNRRAFLALVESMDAAIGRIVDTLDEEGIADNTLIIWVSDNGGQQVMGGGSNTPLRGMKGMSFDGGLRVPAFVLWPGVLDGGRVHEQLFTVLDWLPTLAELVGFELPEKPLDGVSLWKSLRDGVKIDRPWVILGGGVNSAVFRGDFKLVEQQMGMPPVANRFLFRIWEDPNEERDVAAANPTVMAEMTQILRDFPRGTPDRLA